MEKEPHQNDNDITPDADTPEDRSDRSADAEQEPAPAGEAGGADGAQDDAEQEKKQKLNWRNVIIGSVALIVITAVTLIVLRFSTEMRFKELPHIAARLNPWFILAGFACLAGYIYSEGRAMAAAGRAINVKINRRSSTLFSCTELFFSALTPSASGGQPAAAYFMAKEGIRVAKSSVILLNNTLHYTLTLLVMGGVASLWRWKFMMSMTGGIKLLFLIGVITNTVALAGCLLFIFMPKLVRKICVPVINLLAKLHFIKNREKVLDSFESALCDYGECQKLIRNNPFAQIKIFLWNLLQRVFSFSIAYFVYRGFGFDEKTLLDIIFIQTIVAMAVNALPLPGAVGASEASLYLLYRFAGIYTVKKDAVNAMIFTRVISYYSVLLICGAATVLYYIAIHKRRNGSHKK